MKEGTEKGQSCNRNGCDGIITEYEKEGGCCCHINPPCSFCTEDNSYCPKCEWYANELIVQESKAIEKHRIFEDHHKRRRLIIDKIKSGVGIDRLEWFHQGHTHFSMIKEGVYPKGMTKEELIKNIRGSFGGRFINLNEHSFKYVAYTD